MHKPTKLTDADFKGMAAIARARGDNLANLFAGTHLAFGRYTREKTTAELLKQGQAVYDDAKTLVQGAKFAAPVAKPALSGLQQVGQEFLTTCADVADINDIVEALGMDVTQRLISEITPFLGVLTSSYHSVQAWRGVYKDVSNLYRSKEWIRGVLPGDPVAAAIAVQQIIKRDLAMHSADAARETAVLGTKVAGLFVDFGSATTAAIGLANTTAELALMLARLGVEIKDLRAGNKALAVPDRLNLKIFESCPILGCYLLSCSDTSMVINIFVADIGLPNWMARVEEMKKTQLEPLLRVATKAIQESRLELRGLEANKGLFEKPEGLALAKAKVMNAANNFRKLVRSRLA